MTEDTPINKFKVSCSQCLKEDKLHETTLYINWEKRYYMIHCYRCNTSEAFNEEGKPISFDEVLAKQP